MDLPHARQYPPPRVLTAADLALVLDIHVSTARRWLRDGRLPGIRLGRRWYASREAVISRIEALSESDAAGGRTMSTADESPGAHALPARAAPAEAAAVKADPQAMKEPNSLPLATAPQAAAPLEHARAAKAAAQPESLSLLPQHAAALAASAIAPEVIAARGYRTVHQAAELSQLGFAPYQCRTPGLLVPVWTVAGTVGTYQLRPDQPRQHRSKAIKYETPAGTRLILDVPPSIRPAMRDPACDLWVTEGAKKADAAVSKGLTCVALLGVWGWRGKNAAGGKAALPDWESIALNGRKVFIAFDSDVMINPKVQAALDRLAGFLGSRGALVHRVTLPPGPNGGKVGLDDCFAAGGSVDDLEALGVEGRTEPAGSCTPASGMAVPSPYFERNGELWWSKPTRDGPPVAVRLASFTARIVAQVVVDDGAERRTTLELTGTVNGRAQSFQVTGAQFTAMTWPIEHLGAEAILSPGMGLKEHARVAIQTLSRQPAARTVYRHTGWRQVNGKWIYLHAGGAIGTDGTQSEVGVDLPDQLAYMRLPAPPTGTALHEAVRASLALLELTGGDSEGDAIMAPALGLLYRSVLGTCDLSLHLSGETGSFKTEVLARLMQHFGPGLDRLHLPSWTSTANALEGLAFYAKDAVLAVDDFVPQGTPQDRARLYQLADRIFRGVGNRAGRSRMKPDGTPRPDRTPRGVVFSTGEDIPVGRSCLARVLVIEVPRQRPDRPRVPGAVVVERLTAAQQQGEDGQLARAMAGFVQWIAGRYEAVQARLRVAFLEARDRARSTGTHARDPDKVAHIVTGWQVFLAFAEAVGAIDRAAAGRLLDRAWVAMARAIEDQDVHQRTNDPALRFLELVASAISAGHAFVAGPDGGPPAGAERRWGWMERRTGSTSVGAGEWAPRNLLVGWVDGENLFLDPDAAIKAANAFAQGTAHIPGPEALGRRLRERGLLITMDTGRNNRTKVRRTLAGSRRDVWHIDASRVLPPEECPPCPNRPTPAGNRSSEADQSLADWDASAPSTVPVSQRASQAAGRAETDAEVADALGDRWDTRDTDPEDGTAEGVEGEVRARRLAAHGADVGAVAALEARIERALRQGDDELTWRHVRVALESQVGFAAASEAIAEMQRRLEVDGRVT